MARRMNIDHLDIYRQLVTREGVYQRDWNAQRAGEPYKTIEAYGPYFTKNVGGDPWYRPAERVTIEIQKLGVVDGELKWVTVKKKVRDDKEDEDG